MINFPAGARIWLVAGVTDMRCSLATSAFSRFISQAYAGLLGDNYSFRFKVIFTQLYRG